MRRRRPDPTEANFPPQLAVFDVGDWWVTDLEDPTEVSYARIRWTVARRVYLEGGDWESHLLMPAWWAFRGDRPGNPQTRTEGQRQYGPDGQKGGGREGVPGHPPRTPRARPIKLR